MRRSVVGETNSGQADAGCAGAGLWSNVGEDLGARVISLHARSPRH